MRCFKPITDLPVDFVRCVYFAVPTDLPKALKRDSIYNIHGGNTNFAIFAGDRDGTA